MSTQVAVLALLATVMSAGLPAQSTSLFGRRAGALETESPGSSMPGPEPAEKEKGKAEADAPSGKDTQAKPAKPAEPDDPFGAPTRPTEKDNPKPEPDTGVRIRPVEVRPPSAGGWGSERVDFRLSAIGHPLAKVETPSAFAKAWQAFRAQHRRAGQGFERLPTRPESLRGKLLQDLGEGRWLIGDAQVDPLVPSREAFRRGTWSAGPRFQAILVLADGRGAVGETLEVVALRVGSFDVRFDCKVPPAEGRRITLRRVGYVESPVLPDDEATREAFRAAVAAGAELAAVLDIERDCRACNGLGYTRRPVPGKIQDARDPCGRCGEDGKLESAVEHRFRP
jgi:hypothetical protein